MPVGGELSFVIERKEQQMVLAGKMMPAPSPEDLVTMNRLLREQVKALEEQVKALKDQLAGVNTPLPAVAGAIASRAELAAQLIALNETLSQLPGQLDATAKEFRELYPDGVFRVHLDIDIRSNAKDEHSINLSPVIDEPKPVDEPARTRSTARAIPARNRAKRSKGSIRNHAMMAVSRRRENFFRVYSKSLQPMIATHGVIETIPVAHWSSRPR